MPKEFIKGNHAVVKGALLAGCKAYFGYPITPASEIAEGAARYFPITGCTFLQGESEVASINMVYGAASAGVRTMTASSGPGLSLKQEGISYAAGSELPLVIVDVVRGGPGLGNIAPEQSDYNQMVKGGGHGNYKVIVLAPNSCQEMCDLTMLAFDLSDKYRNPAIILTDGYIGQMMEPVEFPDPKELDLYKPWSLDLRHDITKRLVNSIYLDQHDLEDHNNHLQEKYSEIQENEQRYEAYKVDDAELICLAYGVTSRVLKSAVDGARKQGLKVGMLRPVTLFPFPNDIIKELAAQAKAFLSVEMSNGQMVNDIKLAIECKIPVHFYGRSGGVVPGVNELIEQFKKLL